MLYCKCMCSIMLISLNFKPNLQLERFRWCQKLIFMAEISLILCIIVVKGEHLFHGMRMTES